MKQWILSTIRATNDADQPIDCKPCQRCTIDFRSSIINYKWETNENQWSPFQLLTWFSDKIPHERQLSDAWSASNYVYYRIQYPNLNETLISTAPWNAAYLVLIQAIFVTVCCHTNVTFLFPMSVVTPAFSTNRGVYCISVYGMAAEPFWPTYL